MRAWRPKEAFHRSIAVVIGVMSVALIALGVGTRARAQTFATGPANFDWRLHNLDLANSRYAPLDEINTTNVGKLTLKWSHEVPAADNISRGTALVVGGVMYFNAGSKLFAVNAATGEAVWNVQVEPPFPANGRGPTYGDGRIYAYGRTILYAVDAKTGKIVDSFGNKGRLEVGRAALQFKYPEKDPTGYQIAAPPAYYNGVLYVGLAQSESHIPGGLVVAIDGRTGAVKWVFNTIPQGPADDGWEIAKDTWRGGARAGGGMWTQPAIDPELGLLYVNAGNPSPDYDGSARKGTNLFTNSILALNLKTGKLAWHYQTIHHELWDFDLVTGPVLFDVTVGGRTIKGVGSAGKNCFLYLWHRDTGQPINPMVETAVPTKTDVPGEEIWPTQPFPYTSKGVPMQPFCATYPIVTNPELAKRARQIYFPYSIKEPFIVSHGGSSFGSPAFSPRTNLLYVTGKNAAVSFRVNPVGNTLRQSPDSIGHTAAIAGSPERGDQVGVPNTETVTAFNPATGELAWQMEYPSRSSIGSAGNLATAGDLVFQGSDTGEFYAFDARSGEQRFKYTAPRSIRTSPLTYRANGKQFVTIVATNTVLTFGLP
jgi:PQQ-dependent dehydrogenase (methanol/ethanol family)